MNKLKIKIICINLLTSVLVSEFNSYVYAEENGKNNNCVIDEKVDEKKGEENNEYNSYLENEILVEDGINEELNTEDENDIEENENAPDEDIDENIEDFIEKNEETTEEGVEKMEKKEIEKNIDESQLREKAYEMVYEEKMKGACGDDIFYEFLPDEHRLIISGTGSLTDTYDNVAEMPWAIYYSVIDNYSIIGEIKIKLWQVNKKSAELSNHVGDIDASVNCLIEEKVKELKNEIFEDADNSNDNDNNYDSWSEAV